jgi:hypothetical protein
MKKASLKNLSYITDNKKFASQTFTCHVLFKREKELIW